MYYFLPCAAFALQYMRSMNIVHMDIKPQNILLSNSENPKLKLAGKLSFIFIVPIE